MKPSCSKRASCCFPHPLVVHLRSAAVGCFLCGSWSCRERLVLTPEYARHLQGFRWCCSCLVPNTHYDGNRVRNDSQTHEDRYAGILSCGARGQWYREMPRSEKRLEREVHPWRPTRFSAGVRSSAASSQIPFSIDMLDHNSGMAHLYITGIHSPMAMVSGHEPEFKIERFFQLCGAKGS